MNNTPFFNPKSVAKAMQEPDWPRGTDVVVYGRKEYRERALMAMSQHGYHITKFVEVSDLQAAIMGENHFLAAKADFIKQALDIKPKLYTSMVTIIDPRFVYLYEPVIYPPL